MTTRTHIEHQLEVSHQWQLEVESAGLSDAVEQLEQWQKDRLRETYGDFWARENYREAMVFFVEELYAPANLYQRNRQMAKMVPLMFKLLPPSILSTVEQALKAQAMAQVLDFKTARSLHQAEINISTMSPTQYAQHYRSSANAKTREEQIGQIVAVGEALDHMVSLPMIFRTLKMARWPARVAGLSDLQTFLEHGFQAFDRMDGADEFLTAIAERENHIARALREPDGSSLDFAWQQFS
ncbi:MAG: hypothetical protein AB8B96_05545 [Lysobacterales bacterium]